MAPIWPAASNRLGGLVADHLQVARLVDVGVVAVHQLQHFAFGDHVGGVGQHAHHAHVVDLDHHLEGARVEEVADQHRRGVAEHRVGRAAAASQLRLVDHVVVQQGGGVDEFDHRRQQVMVVALVTERARHQQQQHRAHALAACADDVVGDRVDQRDFGGQAHPDHAIDLGEVIGKYREQVGWFHVAQFWSGGTAGAAGPSGARAAAPFRQASAARESAIIWGAHDAHPCGGRRIDVLGRGMPQCGNGDSRLA
jgi:hypothetical protein